jgi:type IV secretion system protein VirB11
MSFQTTPGALGLLSPIAELLNDPQVSEIMLNQPGEVFYEKHGVFYQMLVPDFSSYLLEHLFQLIAFESQQALSDKQPMLSANLLNTCRIQLVLPPTALFHCFALRKQSIEPLSLKDYYERGMFCLAANPLHDKASLAQLYSNSDKYEFLLEAIRQKLNIVISGGTSTGKTTFLNACLNQIPHEERIIVIEDVREVSVPHLNHLRLLASKGEQGSAKISIQDLVQCSLRLRPDRIICGEIRGKEIIDFIAACSTGHPGSMTTIHANSPLGAFSRMIQLYKLNHVTAMTDAEILKEIQSVVDVVVQLSRSPRGRFISEVYYQGIS